MGSRSFLPSFLLSPLCMNAIEVAVTFPRSNTASRHNSVGHTKCVAEWS